MLEVTFPFRTSAGVLPEADALILGLLLSRLLGRSCVLPSFSECVVICALSLLVLALENDNIAEHVFAVGTTVSHPVLYSTS